MKLIFQFFLSFVFCLPHFAQDLLEQKEISLNEKLLELRAAKTDDEMNRLNVIFKSELKAFLETKGVFEYSFKHLKTVAILDSPDEAIRIINWNIEYTDLSYFYCAFVMQRDAKKDIVSVTELIDNLDPYAAKPDGIIDAKNWYGALYFKILPFYRNSNVEYLLLGWDGGTTMSNFKLIDVLTFSNNTIRFGSPVFKQKKTVSKRVVFEYSNTTKMTLRFEPKFNRIVFDHLSPEAPSLEGMYSYYVPDFSYDSYYYKDEMWVLKEDVVVINDKIENLQIYIIGKDGKLQKKKVKNKWINPNNDKNTSNNNSIEKILENEKNDLVEVQSNKKLKVKKNKKKDDPSKMSITTGKQKLRKKKYKN